MIALALLMATAALLLLPLVPAFAEWRTKQDAAPLNIVRTHDSNVKAFATTFRAFILDRMGAQHEADMAADNAQTYVATLAPIGRGGYPILRIQEFQNKRSERAITSASPIRLPNDFTFSREIYGGANIRSGRKNKLRAVLAEQDLFLRSHSIVARWAHAKRVYVSRRCTLAGRVSAETDMEVGIGSTFHRLYAPRIIFSPRARRHAISPIFDRSLALAPFTERIDHLSRTLMQGNKRIPADSTFLGNVSVRGTIQIGRYAHVQGSIKSSGNLTIEANAAIDGAVICGGDLTIYSNCNIRGPILAEGRIFIGQGCRIGNPDAQTTVSAPIILVGENVQVSGSVWASEGGAAMLCGQPR